MMKYFVSYSVSFGGKNLFLGNSMLQWEKIENIDHIRQIQREIESFNKFPAGSVLILNYREV